MSTTPRNIEDLYGRARRRLPAMVADFLDGGALDELTLRRNRDDLDATLLAQRVLADISTRSTATTLLGTGLSVPLIVSPMGLLTLLHPDADVAIARASAEAGSIFIHSPWSGCALRDVVAVAPGRVWAQIAFWKAAHETEQHIEQARTAGVDTLVIAGDVGISSKRERDMRHGTAMPPRPPFRDVVDVALHPGWLWRFATGRPLTLGSYLIDGRAIRMSEIGDWLHGNENPAATWADVEAVRRSWPGKLVVKGIMSPADARRAVDAGVDGVFVSNHGGRQFDDQQSTISALPGVVDAVDGRAEIIVDGGVRRGSDIAKALALGAHGVSAGRPFAYGLAAAGGQGVRHAFEILTGEFSTAMGMVGASSPADLTRDVLAVERPSSDRSAVVR